MKGKQLTGGAEEKYTKEQLKTGVEEEKERDTGIQKKRECCIINFFASWIIYILLSVLAATA